MGDDPNQFGNSRRWIVARGREQPAPARHRLDRPLPDPPPRPDTDIDETLGALTDLVHAGQGPLHRLLDVPASQIVEAQWVAERRGRERFVCEQPPYSILVRGDRGRRAADLPALRHGRDPVEPARRRLADRQVAQGRRTPPSSRARGDAPQRYDLSKPEQPAQARRRRRARRSSPTRPGCRSSSWRSRSCIRHPAVTARDHRPAHDGAARVAARRGRRDALATTCSTASTRSSRPARTSAPPTRAGRTRCSLPNAAGDAGPRHGPPRVGGES